MSFWTSPEGRLRENQSRLCKVKGCNKPRHRYAGYCGYHNWKKCAYGDPANGRRWRPKEFEHELIQVRKLITCNQDHPGIFRAILFLDSWINSACEREGILAQKYCFRLHDEGIKGVDILPHLCAIAVHSLNNPWSLGTDNPLTYALGLAFMTQRKNTLGYNTEKGIPYPLRRQVGKHIRSNLDHLFFNFASSVKEMNREQEEARKEMSQRLNL